MKNLNYIFCTSLLACTLLQAQDKSTEKASKKITDYEYAEAIESYEKLVESGYSDADIFKNLGNANYLNANYQEAGDWYGKLFSLEDVETGPEDMYRYAQTLKSNGEFKASKKWMEKFEAASKDDIRVRNFNENPDFLTDIDKLSGRYTLDNLAINSAASDFAPSYNGTSLIFATARDTGTVSRKIHSWNNEPFLNLYKADAGENGQLSNPIKLSKSLNKKTHESSAAFTKDGTTMYFTRNNSQNGNFARDQNGYSRLKIYRAKLIDGEWGDIVELPFNNDAYSTAHPTLNTDETKLYFASDREGSLGQSDIFVVDVLEDGTFGTPVNLGDTINTEARETFPFITGSDVLYFASDGHPGLGGLDVFAVNLKNTDDKKVINLGKPVNSGEDDFSFIFNEESKKGFFASNREGGAGSDDIYGFTETKPINFQNKKTVEGLVTDDETGKPIAGATIALYNSASETVGEAVSDDNGVFSIEDNFTKGSYRIVATKTKFEEDNETSVSIGKAAVVKINMPLKKAIEEAPVGANLMKVLALDPIYFDLNKGDVRADSEATLDKIVEYLKTFADLKIKINSHTDARGSDSHNLQLSQKRAKSTASYLVNNGIEKSRISSEGFGEKQLINDCTTRESCTDEKHQENRRSEFMVVEK